MYFIVVVFVFVLDLQVCFVLVFIGCLVNTWVLVGVCCYCVVFQSCDIVVSCLC